MNQDSPNELFVYRDVWIATYKHRLFFFVFCSPFQFVAPVLSMALALALYCKWRSANALHAMDCESFLVWHSGWHYVLPLLASGAIWSLPLVDLD